MTTPAPSLQTCLAEIISCRAERNAMLALAEGANTVKARQQYWRLAAHWGTKAREWERLAQIATAIRAAEASQA